MKKPSKQYEDVFCVLIEWFCAVQDFESYI